MLDTNILIHLIKNRPAAVSKRVDALGDDDTLCMSFITWAELLKGAERSTKKPAVLRQLAALSRLVPVRFPADAAICQHHARHFTLLRDAGTPLGGNDLWIGCHALAERATLVTNNTGEFARIGGLALANWAQ